MNKIALILVGLALGHAVPAAAHAQLLGRLVEQAARAAQGGSSQRDASPQDLVFRDQFIMAQRRQGQGPGGDEGDRERRGGRRMDDGLMERPPMRLVSLNQVIGQIQRSTPGRLLDASGPEGGVGRPVYRVRWQADSGQRIDFVIDAQSGAIIGRNGG